jgi:hypothetical protein
VGGAVVGASVPASGAAAALSFVEVPSPDEPALQAPNRRTAAPTLAQAPGLTGWLYQARAGPWVIPSGGGRWESGPHRQLEDVTLPR